MPKSRDAASRTSRLAARKVISEVEKNSGNGLSLRDMINDLILTSDNFDRSLLASLLDRLKGLSDEELQTCYTFIWSKLEQKHSQVRWMCVQLIDELFVRSARIRRWIVRDLQEFVNLTICPGGDLPEPSSFAYLLRNKSISCVIDWKSKFAHWHKKLQMCFEVLHSDMKEAFEEVLAKKKQLEDYQADKRLMEQRKQIKTIQNVAEAFRELEDELLMNLTQAHECIAILADEKRSCDNSKLAETSNNRAVVTSLEESVSFLSRTLPKLKSIKEKFSGSSAEQIVQGDATLLKTSCEVDDFAKNVQDLLSKWEQLDILRIKSSVVDENLKKSYPKISNDNSNSRTSSESRDQTKGMEAAGSSKRRKCSEEDSAELESSSDSFDELDEVPEKEGIEFMNYRDLAKSVGEATQEEPGPSGSHSVQFSVPNLKLNPEVSKSEHKKSSRRKKRKLVSKKSLKDTPRQRLAQKMKQKKL